MMMMSCLCSTSTVKPSTQPLTVGLPSSRFELGDSDSLSEHSATLPSLGSTACSVSSFSNPCSGLLKRVSSNQRLISGTASGTFRSPVGLPAAATPFERCASSTTKFVSTETGSEREIGSTGCDVESITVDELASSLSLNQIPASGSSMRRCPVAVIVDCRGFVSFNANHVLSAFNASCGDRFARKRLMDGKTTVADLVSCGPETETSGNNARDRYRRLVNMAVAEGSAIVAYDDDSMDVMLLPVTHPLRLITGFLKNTGATIKFLLGGLQAFHAAYPLLCSKPNDPPSRPLLYSPTTPVVEMDVDSAEMSEILPYLFIGNERDAASRTLLEKSSINHVLNVTSHIPLHFDDDVNMSCKRLPATDSGRQNLKQYFEVAIQFIESARCSGGRVLVHCQAGVSRSPTIVLAYLMARYNWSMMTAFNYVKTRRHIIAPNFNFMGQLLEFEQRCVSGELRQCLRDDVPPTSVEQVVVQDTV